MSFYAMVLVVIAIITVSKVFLFSNKHSNQNEASKPEGKAIQIVGHTPSLKEVSKDIKEKKGASREAKPMATPVGPKLAPVFLEDEDWSSYDKPAYLRKSKSKPDNLPNKEPKKSTRKFNPKQSMENFQKNGRNRQSGNKVDYEEI